MEKIRIENVKPGMILARSIYSLDGRILVREKTEVSSAVLNRLKEMRLPSVYIETATDGNLDDHKLISDDTHMDLLRQLYKLDTEFRSGKNVSLFSLRQPLSTMIDEIVGSSKNLPALINIRFHNDYTYSHSVNVGMVAAKIGLQMGYEQNKLVELAVGALLHDIGMTRISLDLLTRIGGLTEAEMVQIQMHAKNGFDLLKSNHEIPGASAHVAHQHHERWNGSGYPRGLKGPEMHEYARITAVADVFDAMTTEKLYRYAKTVPETLEYIKSKKGEEFDPTVVDALDQIVSG